MLKRLDKWLKELTVFAYDHPVFMPVTVIILANVAALALGLTLALICGTVASEP